MQRTPTQPDADQQDDAGSGVRGGSTDANVFSRAVRDFITVFRNLYIIPIRNIVERFRNPKPHAYRRYCLHCYEPPDFPPD